jgi:hypothetical protein
MEIAVAGEVEVQETRYPTRPGVNRVQWLLQCEQPDGFALRLYRVEYQGGDKANSTPRHHHAFQQIRFTERGFMNYGPGQDIQEGDIAYFPKGTYYGPQSRDQGVGLTLQFGIGKEMLGGKDSYKVYSDGVEKLRKLGKVENGNFTDTDPATGKPRIRDTWQAVAEELTGERFIIPEGRYETAILMHPLAYEYVEIAPGVETKQLGAFNDHAGRHGNVCISMIRLSPKGVYRLGPERGQLIWSLSDGLLLEGKKYPEMTCLFSPREETAEIGSEELVELYLIEFPRPD